MPSLEDYTTRENQVIERFAQAFYFFQQSMNRDAARAFVDGLNLFHGMRKDFGKMPAWAEPLFEEEK